MTVYNLMHNSQPV